FRLAPICNRYGDVRRLALAEEFRVIVWAGEVGLRHPDAARFLAVLERAGVEPSQALHIGDHPVGDIAGARAVGLHTRWFNRLGVEWTGAEPAHGEVRCLSEIPDWLKAYQG